jgi:hypothetical protein
VAARSGLIEVPRTSPTGLLDAVAVPSGSTFEKGGAFGHTFAFSAPCFPLNSLRFPATRCAILEDGVLRLEVGTARGEAI